MRIVNDPRQTVPLWVWAVKVDAESLKRLTVLARWGRLAGPIAVMPDVHPAGDICVGTVFATADALVPGALGDDLGCGMAVARLPLHVQELTLEDLRAIVAQALEAVPVGRRTHNEPQPLPERLREPLSTNALNHDRDWLAARQMATLGGGNHFIELQRDPSGGLWLTVHVGSRGIGAAIVGHHVRAAGDQSRTRKLPFLNAGSAEGQAFLRDVDWALAYAAENRRQILDCMHRVIAERVRQNMEFADSFDVAHNTITREVHDGRELFIHRKGAMRASLGARGIIPGSMATASYLVEGLGNPESYASCSHGAGRVLTRTQAHERITVKQLRREMVRVVYPEDLLIERAMVEESPSAYRDIKDVLAQQADLVRPLLRLEPVAVIKGG